MYYDIGAFMECYIESFLFGTCTNLLLQDNASVKVCSKAVYTLASCFILRWETCLNFFLLVCDKNTAKTYCIFFRV